MNRLFDGVLHFRKNDYPNGKERFTDLGRRQNPHTLFIGCSDSRLVPNLITHTLPGELFVVRNIANIVPPYRRTAEYAATTSAVEYALQVLAIENIVVCGHSNCGGCAALWDEPLLEKVPHTRRWLELASRARERVVKEVGKETISAAEREWRTEQYNVLEQLKHLLTYPGVKQRLTSGALKVYGWYYTIQSGEVFNYEARSRSFEKIGGGRA